MKTETMKTENQYSPGPWFTCHAPFNDQICSKPEYDAARQRGLSDEDACGESLVCETAGNLPNAKLIASAPELLEALIATWIIIESDPEFCQYIQNCTSKKTGKTLNETVRAAIAKATS